MVFIVFGEEKDRILKIVERSSGSLSVCSSLWIVITFLAFPAFNKSFNRLAFYAAFGNICASTVALISLDGPKAGGSSALCQLQGFSVQMFMPADAYWILAMAINVHLVFFRRYTAADLRRLEWRYILACYGLASIPAITLLFINSKEKGKAYGPAAIWCWIGRNYDILRLPLAYAPVGLTDLIVFVIHFRAGRKLWLQRRQIQHVSSGSLNSYARKSVKKTTHVEVTHSQLAPTLPNPTLARLGGGTTEDFQGSEAAYSVNIEFGEMSPRLGGGLGRVETVGEEEVVTGGSGRRPSGKQSSMSHNVNRAAVVYFRCALLFSLACLVTWVPSFGNRLLTTINPNARNYPLALAASASLPLQGFWNAIIYTINSKDACAGVWERIREKCLGFRFPSLSSLLSYRSRRGIKETSEGRAERPRGGDSKGAMERSESTKSLKGSEESLSGRRGSQTGGPHIGS